MLDSMLDGEEPQVLTTVDSTSPEDREVLTTVDSTSPFAGGERREREKSPHTSLKEKGQENNNNARARERFVKPTVEEVAAYIKAKGYTFDAEQFWNYYESKGWIVGKAPMKSWQSACVTWQKRNGNGPRPPMQPRGVPALRREGRRRGMTIRMALKHIRELAPETEKTFQPIRQNRYCHPVRDWAIYDIQKAENLSRESAERRYYRHLARLHEVFGVSQVG